MMETEINLPYITADAGGPKHLQMRLTRSRFEQMTTDLLERTRQPFETALKDANLKAADIDELSWGWRDPHAQVRTCAQAHQQRANRASIGQVLAVARPSVRRTGREGNGRVLLDVTP